MDNSFWTFLGIAILVIVIPGPDTALTIRNTLLGGRMGGVYTALGICTGAMLWALATSVGMVALLLASEPIFNAVKLAGAIYLIYLGVRSLLSALDAKRLPVPQMEMAVRARLGPLAAFRQGLLNNLGNPKIAVFFASILPQFVPLGQSFFAGTVLLGALFTALGLTWLCFYVFMIGAAGNFLQRRNVRRTMEGITGGVLILLGVRLATESR